MSPVTPPDDPDKRWADTFHEAVRSQANREAMDAQQRALDLATLRQLFDSLDEPTCGVVGCTRWATYVAYCTTDSLVVLITCDRHQLAVQQNGPIRLAQCGHAGHPTVALRWRPLFAVRSRA